MLQTHRELRTGEFRKQTEKEWQNYFWKFIKDNNLDIDDACYYHISENENVTFDIVLNNLDKAWQWDEFAINPNLTFDIVLQFPDKRWDWFELSQHRCITYDIVLVIYIR